MCYYDAPPILMILLSLGNSVKFIQGHSCEFFHPVDYFTKSYCEKKAVMENILKIASWT